MNPEEEKELFAKFTQGHIKSFEILFHRYYNSLCLYASKITGNDNSAEEIVQDFFVKLWEKRTSIDVESSVKSYFFRSIKNHCLNYIKHINVVQKHVNTPSNNVLHDTIFTEFGMIEKIENSINELPKRRREIFKLSREEGLKYREISKKLNISIKTVETQMSLAISTLRKKLKDYLPLLFF